MACHKLKYTVLLELEHVLHRVVGNGVVLVFPILVEKQSATVLAHHLRWGEVPSGRNAVAMARKIIDHLQAGSRLNVGQIGDLVSL